MSIPVRDWGSRGTQLPPQSPALFPSPSVAPSGPGHSTTTPEPWCAGVTPGQRHRSGYCAQQTLGQAEGGGEPGSCSPASAALPGCFSKDQVYLDGILRILRHRQTIDFPLLAALGKVTAGWGRMGG